MATFTENYGLHQWAAEDDFLRTDFNEDFAKLDSAIKGVETGAAQALSQYQTANDAAVAALESGTNATLAALAANLGTGGKTARIAWGSYTGTGTCGTDNPTKLSLDFCPVVVIVGSDRNTTQKSNPSVFVRGRASGLGDGGGDTAITLTWGDTEVSWYAAYADSQNNKSNFTYCYAVLGYDNT